MGQCKAGRPRQVYAAVQTSRLDALRGTFRDALDFTELNSLEQGPLRTATTVASLLHDGSTHSEW